MSCILFEYLGLRCEYGAVGLSPGRFNPRPTCGGPITVRKRSKSRTKSIRHCRSSSRCRRLVLVGIDLRTTSSWKVCRNPSPIHVPEPVQTNRDVPNWDKNPKLRISTTHGMVTIGERENSIANQRHAIGPCRVDHFDFGVPFAPLLTRTPRSFPSPYSFL